MKEYYYDKLLNIKTGAYKKKQSESLHYHPYEPTEYRVLEILLDHYTFKNSDCIVDFGSGKGRLCFFINYFNQVTVKGIEMNDALHQEAFKNKKGYVKNINKSKDKIKFYCCLAETYQIGSLDNRFYFFNPFSIQIFMKIINNILLSVEESERDIELILYYASEDYIFYLENKTSFRLKEAINLPGLYETDPYERFLIYELPRG